MRGWLGVVFVAGCSGDPEVDEPADTADSDTAVDTDTDTDTDTEPVPDPDDQDLDGFAASADCDDDDPTVYPGAPDRCGDDRVTDCTRTTDDGLVTVDGDATFLSLDEALAAAAAGSEVRLCAGTFTGSHLAERAVSLVGHAGRDTTILDAQGAGPVLILMPGSTVTGLTLTGGRAADGGGIRLFDGGTLTVTDTTVSGNTATDRGGGVWLAPGAVATFVNSALEANVAPFGAGLYADRATLDLTGSSVSDNVADAAGGGLYLVDGEVVGGSVTDNVALEASVGFGAPAGGGGVYAVGAAALTGTDIARNEARVGSSYIGLGGGLHAADGRVTLTDVTVRDNVAERGFGGGLYAERADVVLAGATTVSGNQAADGGGVGANPGTLTGGVLEGNVATDAGGGAFVYGDDGALDGVTLTGNDAALAGGVYFTGSGAVRDCVIDGNTAQNAGGIYAITSSFISIHPSMTIERTVITGNSASDTTGGIAIGSEDGPPATVVDLTIADNVARDGAGMTVSIGTVEGVSTTIVRNVASRGGGGLRVEYSAVVSLTDCDLGVDADDNLPDDIDAGGHGFTGYGAGVTVTCGSHGCDPAP